MPLIAELSVGEGVRIDAEDIWLLKDVIEDGTAAVLFAPGGLEVTIHQDVPFRAAPGLRLSVAPCEGADRIKLVIDAYVPLIHRYPPRTGKPMVKAPKAVKP